MKDAFDGTYILKVSADLWMEAANSTGFVCGAIPSFFRLDSDGKPVERIDGSWWGRDIAAEMAPPLDEFFHQSDTLWTRIVRWDSEPSSIRGQPIRQWVTRYKHLALQERRARTGELLIAEQELENTKQSIIEVFRAPRFSSRAPPHYGGTH